MDRYSLEFQSSHLALWLALVPAFLALAVWVYYRTLAPLDRPTRLILRLLRGLAFLVVLFALAEPVLTLVLPEPGKPGLAILVDGSASMALPSGEGSESRAENASELAQQLEERLSGHFRLDWFRFQSELTPLRQMPTLEAEGNTALGEALERIAARQGSRPVGGVIVLSDGANTVGLDPVGSARNAGVPIFPIRIGEPVSPIDARILQVRTNPTAFANEPTPVEVEIASSGLTGHELEVRVEDDGRLLASESVLVEGGDDLEQTIRFDVRPVTAGRRRFEVRIVDAEDQIPGNDSRSVAVQVFDRKTRVLVLEGRLDWDHTFLRRTLAADSSFSYRFLIADRTGRWLPERAGGPAPGGPGELRDYAVVILGDLPASALDARFYGELTRYVEGGGALLALGGRRGLSRLQGTPVARLLPAEVTTGVRQERPLPIRLTPTGVNHPVTSLDGRPGESLRDWAGLPPIWPSPDRIRPKPEGSVLLGFENREETTPALVVGFAGEGKVGLLAAHDFWRWGFLPKATGEATSDLFEQFVLRAVRWLAEPARRDRFVAGPVRGVFQNGEIPEFEARVWDERYRPVSDARVSIEITPVDTLASREEQRVVELRPRGLDGSYGGETPALPPGVYRYRAEARGADKTVLGQSEALLWVDENGGESIRVRPDPGTLNQIARASGGEAFDPAAVSELIRRLPDVVRRIGRVREIELWNQLALFLSFVLLLSVEWFLRRRRGLV